MDTISKLWEMKEFQRSAKHKRVDHLRRVICVEGHLCALRNGRLWKPRLAEVEEQPRLPVGAPARTRQSVRAATLCSRHIAMSVAKPVQHPVRLAQACKLGLTWSHMDAERQRHFVEVQCINRRSRASSSLRNIRTFDLQHDACRH